ncbi:MAG: hypothetical protein V1887_01890 [Candidatus Aenigmatarchaeota archaeon]
MKNPNLVEAATKPDIRFNPKRYTYSVDHHYFKMWTPQMAYILGFVFADGGIERNNTTLAFELQMRDKEILRKIRAALKSTHPISATKAGEYVRLRINSRQIVDDLKKLGVTHNKSKDCTCPDIPQRLLPHFVRGFVDGDGWIIQRTGNNRHEISAGFCHGSKGFLRSLVNQIRAALDIKAFNLRAKYKATSSGKRSCTYSIEWYSHNASKFLDWTYKDADIFLKRKYQSYLRSKRLFEEFSSKTRLWRKVETKHRMPLRAILDGMLARGSSTCQISGNVGVSSATIYRWLDKTDIRKPVKRVSKAPVLMKCQTCGDIFRKFKENASYCSLSCAAKHMAVSRLSGNNVTCAACGKRVYRPNWWFAINSRAFCSNSCHGKWQETRLATNSLQRCRTDGRFLPASGRL